MLLLYPQYYRSVGVRKEMQLSGFVFKPMAKLLFPKRPIYHYLPLNAQEWSVDANDPFIQAKGGLFYCKHVPELKSEEGRPIRIGSVNVNSAILGIEKKNRKLRRIRQFEMVERDLRSTMVYSYALLQHLYRYPKNYMVPYHRWQNIFATMIETINELGEVSDRQQFIHINLPQHLPRLALLKLAERALSRNVIESLPTHEAMFIADLWLWAGKDHGRSILSKLKPEVLDRVNLIITDNGQGGVVNLGLLNSWRTARAKTDGDEITAGMETFQRRVLYFFVSLAKLRAENLFTEVQEDTATDGEVKPESVKPNNELAEDEVGDGFGKEPDDDDIDVKLDIGDDEDGDTDEVTDKPVTIPERNSGAKDKPEESKPEEFNLPSTMSEKEMEEYREELESLAEGAVDVWNDELFDLHIPGIELGQVGNETKPSVDITAKPELGVIHRAEKLLENALISGAEFRRFEKLANSYKSIKNPYGEGTLENLIDVKISDVNIATENVVVPDHDTVTDKTMLRSTLLDFDKSYIKNVLHRDIARMVMSLQHSGVSVTDYQVDEVKDAMNKYNVITIKLVPVAGKPSTVRIELPSINEDGSWVADGVKYSLRKQRGDCPIHKVAPDKVALSSYYSKLFVKRSEKAVHNYRRWLQNRIIMLSMGENPPVTGLTYKSKGRQLGSALPRLYMALSSRFIGFNVNGWTLSFDHANRAETFGPECLTHESNGLVTLGRRNKGNQFLYVDENDSLYYNEGDKLIPIGDIGDLVGFDNNKAPIEQVEMKVAGKELPLGFIFGYYFGLEETCRKLGVAPRKIPKGQRVTAEHGEYFLRFKDETWALSRHDRKASLVLSGLNRFHRVLAHYSVAEFNRQDVYFNLLDGLGMTARQLRELDVLMLHFVDPITKTLLEDYKEPTTFDGLLFRSVELLQNDMVEHKPDRFKGYERIAGAVYRELAMALKQYHGKPVTSKASIDIKPNAVWNAIQSDPSISLVQDINPVHHLKEQEAVTFGGVGGRSSRTMVLSTRAYEETDYGVISEATVDSSDVAVNTYLSSDPNFVNLYGVTRPFDKSSDGTTCLLSTTGNLSPSIVNDDMKRALFASIQQSSGIAAEGYTYMPTVTGYETVLAKRVGDLYAFAAKEDGIVKEISTTHLTVQYQDGTVVAVELGRRFGRAEGSCYPHQIDTDVVVGQKFSKGNILAWNSHWFTRDPIYKTEVLWKSGVLFNIAVLDDADTFEDSSALMVGAAEKLKSKLTKVKVVILKFDQEVRGIVKEGDVVDSDSILCTIEDQLTANSGLFDEMSLDTLKMLSAHTPKAKVPGTVEKIEVFYRGDKEDMSMSLQELVRAYDRKRAVMVRKLRNGESETGEVMDRVRVEGQPLEQDTVAVRFYITHDEDYGGGDKLVFGNQLKSVTCRTYEGVMETESGLRIDGKFGHMSIFNRMVGSPYRLGLMNRLMLEGSKRGAAIYFGES